MAPEAVAADGDDGADFRRRTLAGDCGGCGGWLESASLVVYRTKETGIVSPCRDDLTIVSESYRSFPLGL